ncbi:MAG: hypothetical protein AUG84_00835 [Chloroflexi bacterium 13_1_20CM_4_66_7]|nr:MAG: hypothetical protein AUG84_00835 [Chloroflexi bacterium 13_1_20CM_4_66_7]
MSADDGTVTAAEPTIPVAEPTTPVPAPKAETPPEAAATDRDDKGRFRNPVQPRIDELTRKVRENEREAAFWRARAEAATTPPEKPREKPTADKFDDYGAYVEALADWKADEKIRVALDARDKAAAETRQSETRTTNWQERQAEARKSIPDLDAVMEASDVPIAAHVASELLDSELGPQIAYHLAKHPDIAAKLNGLTPTAAAREIGRLEATLGTVSAPSEPVVDAPAEPVPPAPKAKTTSAPPPVKPTGQGRSTSVDLAKASMDEYVAARKAQGASWARR